MTSALVCPAGLPWQNCNVAPVVQSDTVHILVVTPVHAGTS